MTDLKYCELYQQMRQSIISIGNYYELRWKGRIYRLPVNHFEPVVFFHKHGLDELPRHTLESISGRDFIDVGAFIGDSVLVLNELSPRKIYAIEPIPVNISMLKRTLELNKVSNVTVIDKAVSDSRGKTKMIYAGSTSLIT